RRVHGTSFELRANSESSCIFLARSFIRWPLSSPVAEPEKRVPHDFGDAADDRCLGSRCGGTGVSASTNERAYLAAHLRTQLPGRASRRHRGTGQPPGAYFPRYDENL